MTEEERRGLARRMGRRVRAARAFKGLSPGEVAAGSGLSRSRLVRFEAGVGSVTADELVAVARVLGLPLWFFFEVPTSGGEEDCPSCRGEKPC